MNPDGKLFCKESGREGGRKKMEGRGGEEEREGEKARERGRERGRGRGRERGRERDGEGERGGARKRGRKRERARKRWRERERERVGGMESECGRNSIYKKACISLLIEYFMSTNSSGLNQIKIILLSK